jgi:predicted component of type VI protein secretion system
MSARLVPLNHPSSAPAIPLLRPVVMVGRHPECDVRLDLPKISRRHCCLALVYDRVMIRDLGSRNGLRVNGRVVEEAQLQAGDEVAIGPLLYRVESLQPAPPPAPEPVPPPAAVPVTATPAAKPPSLPFLPNDPDNDLIPLDF